MNKKGIEPPWYSGKTRTVLSMVNLVLLAYLLFIATITRLILKGYLTFGYGLGDWYFVIFTAAASVALVVIYFLLRQFTFAGWILLGFALFIAIVILLKLSIYRGPEYPWHGNFFRHH